MKFSEKYSKRLMIKLTSNLTTAVFLVKLFTLAHLLHQLWPLQPTQTPSSFQLRASVSAVFSAWNTLPLAPFHLSHLNVSLTSPL